MFCFPFVYHACTRDIRVTGLKNKYFIQFFFIFYFLFLKAITEKGVVTIRRKQKQPQNTTQHSHFYFLFFVFYFLLEMETKQAGKQQHTLQYRRNIG
jgi:hypothetical protein